MKRLTEKSEDGRVVQPLTTSIGAAFAKLAKYEDTGLEPDEVLEMKNAYAARGNGEWIMVRDNENGYLRNKCSVCGTFMRRGYKKSPYCPNCGAEMSNVV